MKHAQAVGESAVSYHTKTKIPLKHLTYFRGKCSYRVPPMKAGTAHWERYVASTTMHCRLCLPSDDVYYTLHRVLI